MLGFQPVDIHPDYRTDRRYRTPDDIRRSTTLYTEAQQHDILPDWPGWST